MFADAITALLLSSTLIGIMHFTNGWDIVHRHIGDNLITMYRTTAAIAGAMIGFSMTVTVIALNLWESDWFDLIKRYDKFYT